MSAPLVTIDARLALPAATPLARRDLNPLVTTLAVETQLPGGFARLRVGMLAPDAARPRVLPSLPEPLALPELAHVVARVGGHVLFEGVPVRRAPDLRGFECVGYGLAAGNWSALEAGGDEVVTTDLILAAALRANPWLTVGSVPPSTTRRAWRELAWMTTANVIDTLCREGSGGVPWLYTVYEDRVARIVPKLEPSLPDYRVGYDPATMDVWFDDSATIDALRAVYVDVDGRERTTGWQRRPTAPPSSWARAETLTVSGSATPVVTWLAAQLAERGRPRLTGSIALDGWRGLAQPGGAERPGYLLRAGEWVELPGYGCAVITRTASDLTTGSTRVELGEPSAATLAGLLANLQQTETAVRSRRDAHTGNRDRATTRGGG